jgi:hypothetical protein
MLDVLLDIPKKRWDDDLVVMKEARFKWWIKSADAGFVRE